MEACRHDSDSEQFPEFVNAEACITDDPCHGDGVDRVVARYRDFAATICHYDVLALSHDSKPGLFEGANSSQVVDSGQFCHD